MEKTISIRLDKGFVRSLDRIGADYSGRSSFMRELLNLGLQEYRTELAVEKYMQGEVSTWKAAEIANLSLRKMNQLLRERGVEMHYSEQSLREDLG
ncbi:MAG: UPF0175 family protein [Candidatus Altiarchaeales archaeon]|nr:UPF0175 family protein [Candidatus Altiarchaeota archaeon]MBU4267212.1 UPF0175 family protein [Candidatus Altiarchaeota archaeon]MCG2782105.1 UPF0175 family protein [Candidatus Altiarchaeales archaeon]